MGKAREVGCTVARLRYFSSTFVFSFIPYSPRFKRNFLQLSYTSRSTLFTSSFTLRVYIYIYIFNKFTQRSFNLISQPVSPQRIAANSFCKLKEKILFPLFFSLSLFFHPRVAEKLTEKCYDVHGYDETRQGWGRVEKKEEERRKKYCTSLISRLLRNEKYIYIHIYKMIKNTSGRKLLWYHVERQLSYFSTVFHWGREGKGW